MDRRLRLSRICFGCEPLGGTDWGQVNVCDIAGAVDRALELGVNFFDTADVYGLGLSEIRLSEILGARRHDVVIATKGGMSWRDSSLNGRAMIKRDCSPRYLRDAVEASLRRLRLERLPIYFVHWPDPNTDIRATFELLGKLRGEGKIGWIGCSNFNASQVRSACQVAEISYVQLPVNILNQDIETDMLEVIRERNIGIVAYNALANGLLTGKYDQDTKFPDNDRRSRLPLFQGRAYIEALVRVRAIADQAEISGLTSSQYSIAKVIEREGVTSVIVGIKNIQQIEENYGFVQAVQWRCS